MANTYVFQSWSVFRGAVDVTNEYVANGSLADQYLPTTTLTVSEAIALRANYALQTTYLLTLTPSAGGSISSPKQIYNPGETATVTAAPNTAGGYTLTGWKVDGISYDGVSLQITLPMDSDHTVEAVFTFTQITYNLVLAPPSVGGSISSPKTVYNAGETATITAATNTGYQLTGWLRDGSPYTAGGTSLQISFVMNTSHSVEAVFAYITETFTLTLIQSVGGNIASALNKTVFNAGETATITATADPNYALTNWYVDGVIPAAPKDKANPLQWVMDKDYYVQAKFDLGGDFGTLTVYLTDFPANTVVNLYVDGSTAQVTTNQVGYATTTFENLPVGAYTLTATWTGGTKTAAVNLTSSGATVTIMPVLESGFPIYVIIGGGVAAVVIYFVARRRKGGGRKKR